MSVNPLSMLSQIASSALGGLESAAQLGASLLQSAGLNVAKGMADTAMQAAGSALGLPQSLTDDATQIMNQAFDQAAGSGNTDSSSGTQDNSQLGQLNDQTIGSLAGQLIGGAVGEMIGGPVGEAIGQAAGGDIGGAMGNVTQQLQQAASQANPNAQSDLTQAMTDAIGGQGQQQAQGASGGHGKSWLEALAQAMGTALGNMASKLVSESNQIQSLSGNSSSSGAQQFQAAMSQFQADSQMFSMLNNAFATAIKSIGEGMSSMASKQ